MMRQSLVTSGALVKESVIARLKFVSPVSITTSAGWLLLAP